MQYWKLRAEVDAENIHIVEPLSSWTKSNLVRINPCSGPSVELKKSRIVTEITWKGTQWKNLKGGTTQNLGTQLTNLTTLS